ncbi:TlpA family protein disulfide reductase [Desertivirga brevis]|uniref:TlpA family protein disulfide reductase n=1 Tax=Desertivirga brevis TaxID=2810310 RepID=UPI001A97CD8E|nr:TlpA family protein disulfide reductase [Pedobacter sp. SYSU D00873]
MKTFITCIFLALIPHFLKAQDVKLLEMEKLSNRFELGRDTTYIINFWATWCAPCIAEMPYFEQLQAKYQNAPLKVIFLSLDFKSQLESRVKPLVKKMNFKSEVYLAEKKNEQEFINQISKDWEGAIPATLIISKGKGIRKFYQQEFSFETLENTYKSLK